MNLITFWLLILLHFVLVIPKLTVISPQGLASRFDRKEGIDYRVGEFSKIPYGAHLVGKLALANPLDACQAIKSFAKGEDMGKESVIAVVTKQGCKEGTKLINAQQSGAKMVLLINDNDQLPKAFTGTQSYQEFNVPIVLISKSDGDKIIEYMQRNTNDEQEVIFMSIVFPQNLKKSEVSIDFWFSSADTFRTAFKFLGDLQNVLKNQEHTFIFQPHYVTWTCGRCLAKGFNVKDSQDCISGGRYCAPDPDAEGPLTGKDVVLEDLRQMCLWRVDQKLWWKYVQKFESRCLTSENLQLCSTTLLDEIGTREQMNKVIECRQQSFIKNEDGDKLVNQDLDDNLMLKEEKALQLEYDVTSFPILYLNGIQYHGKLSNINEVQRVMCRKIETMTSQCQQALRGEIDNAPSSGIGKEIIVLICITLFCALIVFYCYRRISKRESQKLALEANNMVFNYFALHDKALKEDEAP